MSSDEKTSDLIVVIYLAFCLDVAQSHMNGAPNEIFVLIVERRIA